MNIIKTNVEGMLIIEPRLFRDARGDWRIPTEHANLSEKDTKHEVLKDLESPFEY